MVLAVAGTASDAVEVTFKAGDGSLAQQVLYRADQAKLSLASDTARPVRCAGE